MSNFESKDPSILIEELLRQEESLKTRLLQAVTLDFLEAEKIDSPDEIYLQGIEVETPIPTIAYRKDSKQLYLGQDGEINRETFYIYVPSDEDPSSWFTKAWFKKIDKNGIESMYVLDDDGFKVFQTVEDKLESERQARLESLQAKMDSEPKEVDDISVQIDELSANSLANLIDKERATAKNMKDLLGDLAHKSRLVPYDS